MEKMDVKPRKVRLALPEICLYHKNKPVKIFSKRTESGRIKSSEEKSKMHMFEISKFFLSGYMYHNKGIKKRSVSFSSQNNS